MQIGIYFSSALNGYFREEVHQVHGLNLGAHEIHVLDVNTVDEWDAAKARADREIQELVKQHPGTHHLLS